MSVQVVPAGNGKHVVVISNVDAEHVQVVKDALTRMIAHLEGQKPRSSAVTTAVQQALDAAGAEEDDAEEETDMPPPTPTPAPAPAPAPTKAKPTAKQTGNARAAPARAAPREPQPLPAPENIPCAATKKKDNSSCSSKTVKWIDEEGKKVCGTHYTVCSQGKKA